MGLQGKELCNFQSSNNLEMSVLFADVTLGFKRKRIVGEKRILIF